MMKVFLLLILTATISCNRPMPGKEHQRDMFDAGDLKVITLFANSKWQTMSVLYGNEAAERSARAGQAGPVPGAVFRLVTYRQADNPYWYGSHINGKVLSVEKVTLPATGAGIYTLEYGAVPGNASSIPEERIAFVLSHRAAVFPSAR